jgi:hydroxypyruvate isomerase
MPRFAANLSLLYNELGFLERFEAAAADGFEAVEFLFPYEWPAEEIAARLRANGLQQVLFNAPPGDAAKGERGLAAVPGREAEFRSSIAQAIAYADALECPRVHVMAGCMPAGIERAAIDRCYAANLRWAAEQFAASGRDVLIEPLNPRDVPGYPISRQDEAHRIVEAIGAPNLKVQMDLYHCQIVEGDVATKIRAFLPTGRVGHIQIAGVPERHEPDVGEMHYPYLFAVLDEAAAACGWDGWVGCEYRPRRGAVARGTSDGLGWMRTENRSLEGRELLRGQRARRPAEP